MDEYNDDGKDGDDGEDGIPPCVEATIIAGKDATSFISEKIEVEGSTTNLSFNLVLQLPPTDKADRSDTSEGSVLNFKILINTLF